MIMLSPSLTLDLVVDQFLVCCMFLHMLVKKKSECAFSVAIFYNNYFEICYIN